MNDKNEYKINGISAEEPEIFGRSKSAEEIKAERRAAEAARRAEAKRQRAAAKATAKDRPKERKDMIIIACVLVGVVLLCVALLGWQFYKEGQRALFQQDETRPSYFLDSSAQPELSEEGIKGAVTKAYYTKGGHLCVEMVLGNGLDKAQHLESILVEIHNADSEKLIASGYTDKVADTYIVPAGSTNTYILYIAPEHVVIADDTLEKITYTITTSGVVVDQ